MSELADRDPSREPLKDVLLSDTALQHGCKQFFAVYRGRQPGVYGAQKELVAQIEGFENPVYRKFEYLGEAQMYLLGRK